MTYGGPLEPLLGPLENWNLDNIHGVIARGESGSGARPMEREWVESISDSMSAGQSSFFLQANGAECAKTARAEN